MNESDIAPESMDVLDLNHAGLSPARPFRFRTIHWTSSQGTGPSVFRWECPPNPPEDSIDHAVELYVPGYHLGNRTDMHCHAFYEIALIREGSVAHVTEFGRTELRRGDALVVTPSGRHAFENYHDLLVTNIYLMPAWFINDLRPLWSEEGLVRQLLAHSLFHLANTPGLYHLRTSPEEVKAWEGEIREIEAEGRRSNPSLALLNGAFLKVLAILNRAFLRHGPACTLPLRCEVWTAAEDIEQAIEQCRELKVSALARAAGFSPDHFTRLFRDATGMTPGEYYQARRIEHACSMLVTTDSTCTDIAHRLRFADSHHFSRVFKRHKNVTPSAYRRGRTAAQGRGITSDAS